MKDSQGQGHFIRHTWGLRTKTSIDDRYTGISIETTKRNGTEQGSIFGASCGIRDWNHDSNSKVRHKNTRKIPRSFQSLSQSLTSHYSSLLVFRISAIKIYHDIVASNTEGHMWNLTSKQCKRGRMTRSKKTCTFTSSHTTRSSPLLLVVQQFISNNLWKESKVGPPLLIHSQ